MYSRRLQQSDPCAGNPCNGGYCQSDDGTTPTCTRCPFGLTGSTCSENINECASNPCQNGAACVDAIDGFTCQCTPAFAGVHCEVENFACVSQPCENGGSCNDGAPGSPEEGEFSCGCVWGFKGLLCSFDGNKCATNPCENGGLCIDADGYATFQFECKCQPGFAGARCERTNIGFAPPLDEAQLGAASLEETAGNFLESAAELKGST